VVEGERFAFFDIFKITKNYDFNFRFQISNLRIGFRIEILGFQKVRAAETLFGGQPFRVRREGPDFGGGFRFRVQFRRIEGRFGQPRSNVCLDLVEVTTQEAETMNSWRMERSRASRWAILMASSLSTALRAQRHICDLISAAPLERKARSRKKRGEQIYNRPLRQSGTHGDKLSALR
jgi:hypothetical protein